jgi:hypothetical protein
MRYAVSAEVARRQRHERGTAQWRLLVGAAALTWGFVACAQQSVVPTPNKLHSDPPAEQTVTVFPRATFGTLRFEAELHGAATGGEPFVRLDQGTYVAVVGASQGSALVEVLDPGTSEYVFGWLPDRQAQIDATPPHPCPHPSDLGALHPQRRLECAPAGVTMDGWIVDHDADRLGYSGTPLWLAQRSELVVVGAIGPAATPGGGLELHVPPDVEIGDLVSAPDDPNAIQVRVVGHFADAASAQCERTPEIPGYPELGEMLDELWCSQQFVVDAIRAVP